MENLSIRKATLADAPTVFDIRVAAINSQCKGCYSPRELQLWTAGTLSAGFAKMVEDKCHVGIVEDAIVGTGMIDLRSGKIDAVFVRPAYMRKGIGRRMMCYLERLAVEAGLAQISLEATLNATAFYRAIGFEGAAISKYCTSAGLSIDCVAMVKELRAGPRISARMQ